MKGEGELEKRYICFSHDCGFKKQKHLFTRFQDVDFKFPSFEIEVSSIWINLGKLTKWPISLANFHVVYLKGARFKYRLYFCSFCV